MNILQIIIIVVLLLLVAAGLSPRVTSLFLKVLITLSPSIY